MKATEAIQTLQKREHRPFLFIAIGVLAYVVLVDWPRVYRALVEMWQDLRALNIAGNSPSSSLLELSISTLSLVCLLAGLAIWVFSIVVSWAAFHKSRKRAYLLVLAFFLIPLVSQPASWLGSKMFNKPETHVSQNTAGNPEIVSLTSVSPAVARTSIRIPLGPLLLLAGLWYLYKSEGPGEPAKGGHLDNDNTTGN